MCIYNASEWTEETVFVSILCVSCRVCVWARKRCTNILSHMLMLHASILSSIESYVSMHNDKTMMIKVKMVSVLNATVCKVYLSVCHLRHSFVRSFTLASALTRLISLSPFIYSTWDDFNDCCLLLLLLQWVSCVVIAHLYEIYGGRHKYMVHAWKWEGNEPSFRRISSLAQTIFSRRTYIFRHTIPSIIVIITRVYNAHMEDEGHTCTFNSAPPHHIISQYHQCTSTFSIKMFASPK